MQSLFNQEYQRLLTILGHITDSGVISAAAHIGLTSVPALATQSPVDIMLAIELFPLTDRHVTALQTLGYQQSTTADWSDAHCFQHDDGHQLYLHGWADETWHHHQLLRDYLRHDESARERYLQAKFTDRNLQDTGENLFFDILLTDFQQDIWCYRREPSIVQSIERVMLTTADGLQYLVPEVLLLFKSRNTGTQERTKNQHDFNECYRARARTSCMVTLDPTSDTAGTRVACTIVTISDTAIIIVVSPLCLHNALCLHKLQKPLQITYNLTNT